MEEVSANCPLGQIETQVLLEVKIGLLGGQAVQRSKLPLQLAQSFEQARQVPFVDRKDAAGQLLPWMHVELTRRLPEEHEVQTSSAEQVAQLEPQGVQTELKPPDGN